MPLTETEKPGEEGDGEGRSREGKGRREEEKREELFSFSLGMGQSGENHAGIWNCDTDVSSRHPGGNTGGQV